MSAATWVMRGFAVCVLSGILLTLVCEVRFRLRWRRAARDLELDHSLIFFRALNRRPYDWERDGL